jgi:hypothetical protein
MPNLCWSILKTGRRCSVLNAEDWVLKTWGAGFLLRKYRLAAKQQKQAKYITQPQICGHFFPFVPIHLCG